MKSFCCWVVAPRERQSGLGLGVLVYVAECCDYISSYDGVGMKCPYCLKRVKLVQRIRNKAMNNKVEG